MAARTTSPLSPLEHAVRANVRRIRRAADLTQQQVADATHGAVAVMTLRRIERGETHPDLDQLEAILAAIPGAPSLAQVITAASRGRQVRTTAEEGEAVRLD